MKRSNTVEEIFVHAPPGAVFRMLDGIARDASWWPGARARPDGDRLRVRIPAFRRGARDVRFVARVERVRPGEGLQWSIERGEVRGHGEWWLEASGGGTVVHYFLDVQPGTRGWWRRWSSRVRRHRHAVRRGMNAVKDHLERVGAPAGV